MKSLLQVLDLPIDRIEATLAVAPFFSDQRPLEGAAALLDWRLDGYLTEQLLHKHTLGAHGDRYLIKANHKIAAEWVMFVGCGEKPAKLESADISVLGELLASSVGAGFRNVAIGLPVESVERMASWQRELEKVLAAHAPTGMECFLAACEQTAYGE